MLYNFFYESSLKAYLMERFNSKVVYKKFVWLLQISHSLKIKKSLSIMHRLRIKQIYIEDLP